MTPEEALRRADEELSALIRDMPDDHLIHAYGQVINGGMPPGRVTIGLRILLRKEGEAREL
jgi:hypothetical protein